MLTGNRKNNGSYLHHVNETVPPSQWIDWGSTGDRLGIDWGSTGDRLGIYWDVGFLLWGVLMLTGGWLLLRKGQQETVNAGS